MDTIISKYLYSLKIDHLPYSQLFEIYGKYLTNNLSFYIPRWNYLDTNILEYIELNPGLIFWGNSEVQYGYFDNKTEKFNETHFFDLLKKIDQFIVNKGNNNLLFYIGLLSYESCHQFEKIIRNFNFYNLPDFYFIFPGNSLLIDHTNRTILKFSLDQNTDTYITPSNKTSVKSSTPDKAISIAKSEYILRLIQIRELILSGEVYQINFTIRFTKKHKFSGVHFFSKLYQINSAPYSFYAKLPHCEIISNSPERFLYQNKQVVMTQPIKGTIKRSGNQTTDLDLIKKLENSKKDGAELSMIVDLMRNDISKVCKPGSVLVKKHKEIQSFANVHHLVSTITGELYDNKSYIELFRATFPGGSITGCPKIAAMKHIEKLECHNRSFYTGSCFIRFPKNNTCDSSILIRTIIKKENKFYFQAGGGIVIDSIPEKEYEECLTKASSFLSI